MRCLEGPEKGPGEEQPQAKEEDLDRRRRAGVGVEKDDSGRSNGVSKALEKSKLGPVNQGSLFHIQEFVFQQHLSASKIIFPNSCYPTTT